MTKDSFFLLAFFHWINNQQRCEAKLSIRSVRTNRSTTSKQHHTTTDDAKAHDNNHRSMRHLENGRNSRRLDNWTSLALFMGNLELFDDRDALVQQIMSSLRQFQVCNFELEKRKSRLKVVLPVEQLELGAKRARIARLETEITVLQARLEECDHTQAREDANVCKKNASARTKSAWGIRRF